MIFGKAPSRGSVATMEEIIGNQINSPTGASEYFLTQVGQGFDYSTPGAVNTLLRTPDDYTTGKVKPGVAQDIYAGKRKAPVTGEDYQDVMEKSDAKVLTHDEWVNSPWARPNIPFDERMTVARAAAKAEMYDEQEYRQMRIDKRDYGLATFGLSLAGQLVGSAADPLNYLPLAGAFKLAAATRSAAILKRAGVGALEGSVSNAAIDFAIDPTRKTIGQDMETADFALDIALGAAFGGLVGGLVGWRQKLEPLSPKNTAQALVDLENAARAIVAGEPINIPVRPRISNLRGTTSLSTPLPFLDPKDLPPEQVDSKWDPSTGHAKGAAFEYSPADGTIRPHNAPNAGTIRPTDFNPTGSFVTLHFPLAREDGSFIPFPSEIEKRGGVGQETVGLGFRGEANRLMKKYLAAGIPAKLVSDGNGHWVIAEFVPAQIVDTWNSLEFAENWIKRVPQHLKPLYEIIPGSNNRVTVVKFVSREDADRIRVSPELLNTSYGRGGFFAGGTPEFQLREGLPRGAGPAFKVSRTPFDPFEGYEDIFGVRKSHAKPVKEKGEKVKKGKVGRPAKEKPAKAPIVGKKESTGTIYLGSTQGHSVPKSLSHGLDVFSTNSRAAEYVYQNYYGVREFTAEFNNLLEGVNIQSIKSALGLKRNVSLLEITKAAGDLGFDGIKYTSMAGNVHYVNITGILKEVEAPKRVYRSYADVETSRGIVTPSAGGFVPDERHKAMLEPEEEFDDEGNIIDSDGDIVVDKEEVEDKWNELKAEDEDLAEETVESPLSEPMPEEEAAKLDSQVKKDIPVEEDESIVSDEELAKIDEELTQLLDETARTKEKILDAKRIIEEFPELEEKFIPTSRHLSVLNRGEEYDRYGNIVLTDDPEDIVVDAEDVHLLLEEQEPEPTTEDMLEVDDNGNAVELGEFNPAKDVGDGPELYIEKELPANVAPSIRTSLDKMSKKTTEMVNNSTWYVDKLDLDNNTLFRTTRPNKTDVEIHVDAKSTFDAGKITRVMLRAIRDRLDKMLGPETAKFLYDIGKKDKFEFIDFIVDPINGYSDELQSILKSWGFDSVFVNSSPDKTAGYLNIFDKKFEAPKEAPKPKTAKPKKEAVKKKANREPTQEEIDIVDTMHNLQKMLDMDDPKHIDMWNEAVATVKAEPDKAKVLGFLHECIKRKS